MSWSKMARLLDVAKLTDTHYGIVYQSRDSKIIVGVYDSVENVVTNVRKVESYVGFQRPTKYLCDMSTPKYYMLNLIPLSLEVNKLKRKPFSYVRLLKYIMIFDNYVYVLHDAFSTATPELTKYNLKTGKMTTLTIPVSVFEDGVKWGYIDVIQCIPGRTRPYLVIVYGNNRDVTLKTRNLVMLCDMNLNVLGKWVDELGLTYMKWFYSEEHKKLFACDINVDAMNTVFGKFFITVFDLDGSVYKYVLSDLTSLNIGSKTVRDLIVFDDKLFITTGQSIAGICQVYKLWENSCLYQLVCDCIKLCGKDTRSVVADRVIIACYNGLDRISVVEFDTQKEVTND